MKGNFFEKIEKYNFMYEKDKTHMPNHISSPKVAFSKNTFLKTDITPKEDLASNIIQKLNEKLSMLSSNHSKVP